MGTPGTQVQVEPGARGPERAAGPAGDAPAEAWDAACAPTCWERLRLVHQASHRGLGGREVSGLGAGTRARQGSGQGRQVPLHDTSRPGFLVCVIRIILSPHGRTLDPTSGCALGALHQSWPTAGVPGRKVVAAASCPKGWQQVPQKLGTAGIDGDETRDGHSAMRTSGWVPGRQRGLAQESG